MHVDVLINSNDFRKYTGSAIKFWSKKKKRKFNQIDLILYASLFFILLLLVLGNYPQINWFHVFIGIAVGIIFLLMIFNEQKKILEPKENGFVFGPTEYDFQEEGIKIKKEHGESFTKWEAVEKVYNAKNYFYVFVDYNLAYIIPKRSFHPIERLEEFIQLLNDYIPGKVFTK